MKLKDFRPSATLKVALAKTLIVSGSYFISTEQDTTEFFDELFLSFLLDSAVNNSYDILDILMDDLNISSEKELLELDINQILKTIHNRPCIYAFEHGGDHIGFNDRSQFTGIDFVEDGNFENSKMLKFKEEIGYADVSIGTISIVI